MATLGKSANIQVLLNNKELLSPSELFDIGVEADFGAEGVQANLSIESLTFRGNARTEVLQIISEGLTGGVGIFEGIPLTIRAFSIDNELVAFDGYLDLTKDFVDNGAENSISVTLVKTEGLNSLNDKLNGVTFGNLVDKGVIIPTDYTSIEYVVEKKFNILENLVNGIVIFLLFEKLADTIKTQVDTATTSTAIGTSSLVAPPAGIFYAVAKTISDIAYFLITAGLLVNLSRRLVNSFLPPKRTHKGINLYTAMTRIAQELGYGFESEQEAYLKKIYYLPSNQNTDQSTLDGFIGTARGTTQGIPNTSDFGYSCFEFTQIVQQLILGTKGIIDEKLYVNWQGSDFFERQADVRLFDALNKTTRYNTEEANRSRLIEFQTDAFDDWTLDNYKGTTYQVLTEPNTVNNPKMMTLEGAERISLPVALGNRKNRLNALETIIEGILEVFDSVINVLGGAFGLNVDFSSAISSKIGLLKVSNNNHIIPKLLYLEGGKMPSNHRDLLGAKAIYDNYYFWKSFVSNADKAQKKIYENVTVPFGIADFTKVIQNAYIYDENGDPVKLTSLKWLLGKDKAEVSYFARGAYTNNLKETFIEIE